ncbi:hypothetical protein MYX06_04700 [Patescibacteria group bacterium AH-259-L05]|nr:hypothetical protein [Patescibacteria group bacterium AH-259-L05]
MRKVNLQFSLPVTILKEKNRFVAYSPTIDLSTSGKTYNEAQSRFTESSLIFFEEIINKGTIDDVLNELGWQKIKKRWQAPVVVSQQSETVSVPMPVKM